MKIGRMIEAIGAWFLVVTSIFLWCLRVFDPILGIWVGFGEWIKQTRPENPWIRTYETASIIQKGEAVYLDEQGRARAFCFAYCYNPVSSRTLYWE